MLSLWLFGQTLNIFSEIGNDNAYRYCDKNGILIVEFANQKREAGLNIGEAALKLLLCVCAYSYDSMATIFGHCQLLWRWVLVPRAASLSE